jgi:hypothetical protein
MLTSRIISFFRWDGNYTGNFPGMSSNDSGDSDIESVRSPPTIIVLSDDEDISDDEEEEESLEPYCPPNAKQ